MLLGNKHTFKTLNLGCIGKVNNYCEPKVNLTVHHKNDDRITSYGNRSAGTNFQSTWVIKDNSFA